MDDLCRSLLVQALTPLDENPYLTYETMVTRFLKRLAQDQFRVPWTTLLETFRQAPCCIPEALHGQLYRAWKERGTRASKPFTLEEQHCVERILGRDYVRATDLLKLAGCFAKLGETERGAWTWFAVDGFLGPDPKRYVDAFRYDPDEVRGRHAEAVRRLYRERTIPSPQAMRDVLERIFEGEAVDGAEGYVEGVGGWPQVKEVAEWRRNEQGTGKRGTGKRERGEDE